MPYLDEEDEDEEKPRRPQQGAAVPSGFGQPPSGFGRMPMPQDASHPPIPQQQQQSSSGGGGGQFGGQFVSTIFNALKNKIQGGSSWLDSAD